jgi:hypothetical protein
MLTIRKEPSPEFRYELTLFTVPAENPQPVLVPKRPLVDTRPRHSPADFYKIYKPYIKEIISDVCRTAYSVHDSPIYDVTANKRRIKKILLDALYNSSSCSYKHYNFLK